MIYSKGNLSPLLSLSLSIPDSKCIFIGIQEKKIINMPIIAMLHLIGDRFFVTSEKIWFANNSLAARRCVNSQHVTPRCIKANFNIIARIIIAVHVPINKTLAKRIYVLRDAWVMTLSRKIRFKITDLPDRTWTVVPSFYYSLFIFLRCSLYCCHET